MTCNSALQNQWHFTYDTRVCEGIHVEEIVKKRMCVIGSMMGSECSVVGSEWSVMGSERSVMGEWEVSDGKWVISDGGVSDKCLGSCVRGVSEFMLVR